MMQKMSSYSNGNSYSRKWAVL